MTTMLVVDDEIYALKGITQGIDWSGLPVSTILEARDVRTAMELIEQQPVELVISDIEMQDHSGLDLLRWIHDHHPRTLVIFLSGHARFEYAREALQLGCFDYALKPIDHDVLKDIVRRALQELEEQRQQRSFEETLELHLLEWRKRMPALTERFWQDLVARRVPMTPERLNRQLELYDIPLRAEGKVLPLLLSIEHWNVDTSAREENVMEYAIRQAAQELISGELPGVVFQDSGELNLMLLYCGGEGQPDREVLLSRCSRFTGEAEQRFHCRISCYVGGPVPALELPGAVDRLRQAERTNVSGTQRVIDAAAPEACVTGAASAASMPNLQEWEELLEQGLQEELLRQLDQTAKRLQEEQTSRETLEQLYYGLLHLFFQAAQRKGASVYDVLTVQELNDPQATRSPQQLQQWAARLAAKLGDALEGRQQDASPIIAKAHAYIQEHLQQDMSRDDIAFEVSRNPAYLSRLFRKETGMSLSEYITQQRIERAKKLLVETDDKISSIAEGLGYVHFSYFAKLFRKLTGHTPQDYRRIYRTP